MHFQKQNRYQYQTHDYIYNNQPQNPRTNRYTGQNNYQSQRATRQNIIPSPDMYDSQKRLEISNDETNPQNPYKSTSIIRSIRNNIDEKYTPSQLIGDQSLSSQLHNRFGEEREPSPKTINIGDTKETIEYNIRTLNVRKSPQYYEDFNPPQDMNYLESNESEPRNGSFDGRKYLGQNNSYIDRENERGSNIIINRYNNDNNTSMNLIDKNGVVISGNIYNGPQGGGGGRVSLGGRQWSPYQNYEEMNTSNDVERFGSEEKKHRTYIGNTTYDNRQSHFDQPQKLQNQPVNNLRIMNDYYNRNNYNYNNNNYNNINRVNMNPNMNNMTQYPVNTINIKKDDIQEKYANKTYDNMTYKDVKKIVRRFTKVYDPNKNSNGLLVEESQITVPGANDDIFNNRYRVLAKMNRLSNILLSKRRSSAQKIEEDYNIYNNYSDEYSGGGGYNSDEYNIKTNKTFNRQSFEKREKSPLKLVNRKSPENKFKYVSLAMISSKRLRTEDRIILRKMRFEKGGVVDLAQEKRRGKYKIRKVSRSPGYKKNFYRTNPKYRERAARYIQNWWRLRKDYNQKKIKKIIKIQSVYRGRFVRKYLYDLLYLNYLYLSFCQKIEKVLKQEIKPYVFNILKNYRKKKVTSEDEKDFNKLRNIVASKEKKWRIINLRKYFDRWKKCIKTKEKLLLVIYKLIKVRAEKQNRKSILREALKKWDYNSKAEVMLEKLEEDKNIIKKKNIEIYEIKKEIKTINVEEELEKMNKAKEDHTNKIKGLFKLLNGINRYTKKSALEPTLPKLIYYLSNEYLNNLLKKIINRKINDDKEKLKYYFYKYIKMTLKYIKNRINELPHEIEGQESVLIPQLEPIKKQVKEQRLQIIRKRPEKKTKIMHTNAITLKKTKDERDIEMQKREKDRLTKLMEEQDKKKNKEMSLMKARILLHIINSVKNKQNKNILRKYFTKYFKKVIQLQREEDRQIFEEEQRKQNLIREKERKDEDERQRLRDKERKDEAEKERQRQKERKEDAEKERQRERERQLEKEKIEQIKKELQDYIDKNKQLEKERDKSKDKIIEYKELIEKYKLIIKEKETIIDDTYEKAIQELLDKLEGCEILKRFVLRNTYKYPLGAFDDKLSVLRKTHLLKKILKTKVRIKKYILRKYFDRWANKTFDKYRKETTQKTFVKMVKLISDNYIKRLLRKKLYQWRNNAYALKNEEEKELLKDQQPNIYNTLKIIKDIISFNDYLRNITVNKYGRNFLSKLDKTRNPLLKKKYLRKFVKIKIIREKGLLRRAFNKWKNIVDVENTIKKLRTKLTYLIYDKNKNINNNNLLQKYFNRWRNINTVEKIKSDINILKNTQKETKVVSIKTIIRNKNRNQQKDILKKYLNKWRNVIKTEKPLLDEFIEKITRINIIKNGPDFLDKLNKERIYNKKRYLISQLVPKRLKNEKMLLYKYLLRWRNKIYGINTTNKNILYGEKILSLILNKNDKEKLLRAFNKWRYGKSEKVPINAYLAAIKKIKTAICRKPFEKFVNRMDKTNPKKLKPKILKVIKIFTKIIEKPFDQLIKNLKTLIRVNKLKEVEPKIHDITKKYYLLKYLNRWRNNTKKQREKNMKIISKWLRKKYDIEKDKKRRRRTELLKRILNSLIKEDKHRLRFPLHFWKRIAMIYKDNDNARIIQNFCRQILLRKKKNKFRDQKKLTNLIIRLYKKTIIKRVTNRRDVGQVNKFLNTKKNNIRKLRKIIKNRDRLNDKLLLRLAFLKWNEGKDKYEKSIQIIQNKIRQLISKNKLDDKRLLIKILKHIIKNNENKNKNLLRNKFLQWYAIAKKLNYHDTSKIEEFIRKIVVERLRRKLYTILNRYTYKYFIYLLKNIAKLNILRKTLRKQPLKDAFDKIKNYIRKKDIKNSLNIIVKDKDDTLRKLLLREYLSKWRNKVKDIKDKENASIIIIQKLFRGKKVKNDVDKERRIKKILKQIVITYDEKTPLHLYFIKWRRITRKIICDENARIIQKFCRQIHNKYLNMQKNKNKKAYEKLVKILVKLGKKPKQEVFDILYIIYRNNKLKDLVDILNNKRKKILKDAFDNIKNSTKDVVLKNTLDIKDNHRKRILRKYLIDWRNRALSNKYLIIYLTKFVKTIEKTRNDILKSTLYTWLYKAHYRTMKENERIISLFCKGIMRKIYIQKKWKELSDKLRHIVRSYDIEEIRNQIKNLIGLKLITKVIKRHVKRDVLHKLNKVENISTFKEKITVIVNNIDKDNKEISIKKYFDIWRNNVKKIKDRLKRLDELMTILGIKQIRDDATTLNRVFLIKKIFDNIPKLFLIKAFNRIRQYADSKIINKKLADDLLRSENDIKTKRVSPLIKKIYKIYAYKVIDNLFNNIEKGIKRQSIPSKFEFLKRLVLQYSNINKEYTYSNKIQNENKPYTKKIMFKTKKKVQPKKLQDKSQIYLSLTSILVKLIDDIIKKNKKDTFDKIKKRFITEKLYEALKRYAHNKEMPNFEEFLERLKILVDMYEHEGPQQAKLFKLLRRIIIKKLFIYKEEVYHMNKLFYLINLTMFNQELAKNRWIRQLIRKWRFVTFMKKMARKKMELMYKNLHVSYLEMVNSIFSDEEKLNPSVVKEFERFGYDVGMFINEDPFTPKEGKNVLGVKKQYLFQPIDLDKLEKKVEIKKKIVEKEIKEEYITKGSKGEYDNIDSGRRTLGMSGKMEYDYDYTGNRFDAYSSKKDDKDKSKSKIKDKSKSKLKAHYSTKPSNENEEKENEEDEKEENM